MHAPALQIRKAHPRHGPAGPHFARPARVFQAALPRPPLPGAHAPGALLPRPAHDHERRGLPRGGTGAISNAIGAAASELGAEIRMNAPVAKILARDGKAAGVILENGDEIHGKIVASSCDPNLTFLKWTDKSLLPDDFLTEVKRYKYRGSSGKVNLALDGLPELRCKPGHGPHLRGAISISPSMEYMERAYDDAKYGQFSRRPYVDVVIPTLTDPSMAPPGKHTMSCFVQYAPYKLAPGHHWDDRMRDDFGDAVINAISEHMPNLKSLIVGKQVLSPADVHDVSGLTE